jgi:hypothetical protein
MGGMAGHQAGTDSTLVRGPIPGAPPRWTRSARRATLSGMRPLLVMLCLALAACATTAEPPSRLPPDVTDPERTEARRGDGFTLWVVRECLPRERQTKLFEELARARAFLVEWLGPGLAPGDFRPPGAREACPPDAPRPAVPQVDVVVIAGADRCHADQDGLVLVPDHLDRHDATHELVHYLAGASWRPIDEGLAVHLTERLCGADRDVPVKVRARVFLDLGLQPRLDPTQLARDGMSRRDYDVAGAFVGWLIESFGKERFLQLYAGAERNYHGVYGLSEQELLFRFWQHVRSLDVRLDRRYHQFKAWITEPR